MRGKMSAKGLLLSLLLSPITINVFTKPVKPCRRRIVAILPNALIVILAILAINGMSSHDEALKHEVAAATVDAMLAGDKSCQTSGMRNYIPRCRDEFSTGVYIASSGSHIISEMYTFDVFACAGFCDVPLEIVIHVLLYVCNYISYALSHE